MPFFCSRCLSFLLMCLSMLVSPRVMRAACHSVRAPRASATELGTARHSGLHLTPSLLSGAGAAFLSLLLGQGPELAPPEAHEAAGQGMAVLE